MDREDGSADPGWEELSDDETILVYAAAAPSEIDTPIPADVFDRFSPPPPPLIQETMLKRRDSGDEKDAASDLELMSESVEDSKKINSENCPPSFPKDDSAPLLESAAEGFASADKSLAFSPAETATLNFQTSSRTKEAEMSAGENDSAEIVSSSPDAVENASSIVDPNVATTTERLEDSNRVEPYPEEKENSRDPVESNEKQDCDSNRDGTLAASLSDVHQTETGGKNKEAPNARVEPSSLIQFVKPEIVTSRDEPLPSEQDDAAQRLESSSNEGEKIESSGLSEEIDAMESNRLAKLSIGAGNMGVPIEEESRDCRKRREGEDSTYKSTDDDSSASSHAGPQSFLGGRPQFGEDQSFSLRYKKKRLQEKESFLRRNFRR